MTLNKRVRILLLGANIWYLGEGMLGPLFAIFSQQIGGTILDIAWAWSVYLIVTGVLNIVVGKFSDGSASKARLMVFGYGLNAVCTFFYLLVRTPAHLMILQMALGIASAMATPTWSALYAKYEDKGQDGFEWGLASGQASIVTGLAVLLGGVLVNYFSFTVLFVAMGSVQLLATIVQARILSPEYTKKR